MNNKMNEQAIWTIVEHDHMDDEMVHPWNKAIRGTAEDAQIAVVNELLNEYNSEENPEEMWECTAEQYTAMEWDDGEDRIIGLNSHGERQFFLTRVELV